MIQQHGGNITRLNNILDFSANINPLGIPESVKKAILESLTDIENYPDPYCTELRKKLAVHECVSIDNIVCGNGADDLIFRIVNAFKPHKALICAPSFSEYSRALSEADCEVIEHFLDENNNFDITESILDKLDSSIDMCIICTPNNPTGRLIPPEILRSLSVKCMKNGIILVCDECFSGFVHNSDNYTLRNSFNDNCIILKAFTKLYAMAGLRLGYAVCGSIDTAERIQNSGQLCSVSSIAKKAGTAVLDEEEYVCSTVKLISEERHYLSDELRNLGLKVFDSDTNFILFKGSSGLCKSMIAENILIRDCSNFSGLSDEFFRIAVRTHIENLRLVTALGRCING